MFGCAAVVFVLASFLRALIIHVGRRTGWCNLHHSDHRRSDAAQSPASTAAAAPKALDVLPLQVRFCTLMDLALTAWTHGLSWTSSVCVEICAQKQYVIVVTPQAQAQPSSPAASLEMAPHDYNWLAKFVTRAEHSLLILGPYSRPSSILGIPIALV